MIYNPGWCSSRIQLEHTAAFRRCPSYNWIFFLLDYWGCRHHSLHSGPHPNRASSAPKKNKILQTPWYFIDLGLVEQTGHWKDREDILWSVLFSFSLFLCHKTLTKNNTGSKGLTLLTLTSHSLSLRVARAGSGRNMKARTEAEPQCTAQWAWLAHINH